MLVLIYIIAIAFILTAGDKGILIIKKKEAELLAFAEKSKSLNSEIKQIKNDIERLKTDKEYLVASAKIYGYLEGDNEKIVKIIEEEKEPYKNQKSKPTQVYPSSHKSYGIIIFFIISIFNVAFCLFAGSKMRKAGNEIR